MIKLKEAFNNIKDFYKPLEIDYLFDSILQGFTSADIYVDDKLNPTLSMVVQDKAVYFGGQTKDLEKYQEVIDYFIKNILNKSLESGLYFIKVIYTSSDWEQAIKKELTNKEYKVYSRLLFNHDLEFIPNHHPNDDGIELFNIDKDMIDRQLINTNELMEEIVGEWKSIKNFYNYGFGVCAVKDKSIIGWCTAEYMSQNSCGIGIETIKAYMGKNIGSSMTSRFLKICKEKSLQAHWDSWAWNEASVKVAKKCGFKEVKEYKAMMIKLK